MSKPHNLKHTFGSLLRAEVASLETRKVLLGHMNGNQAELLEAASRARGGVSRKSHAMTLLKRKIA
jgi:site-specific recombinase XerD